MSTIPFTPIEGHLALPRLRPLSHLPAPFGRDWALLPPGYSFRAELKALYAALLRTFCMSDQAIRSLCRWSPQEEQHVIAAAPAAPQATVFEAPRHAAAHTVTDVATETAARPSRAGSASAAASRAPASWGLLAGGACALGGAAVLAWIGFDHLAHRHTPTHANIEGTVPTHSDSQAAHLRPTVTAPAMADGAAGASVAVAASAPARSGAASALTSEPGPAAALASTAVPVPATTSAPALPSALPTAAAPVLTGRAVPSRRMPLGEKADSQHKQNQRHYARHTATRQTSHVAARAVDISRIVVPKPAAHVSPRPSAAGPFSPFAPARLGVDDYANVTMSAATHLRDITRPPRPATSNNSPAASGTEWMNHLSQRRVTEVPDQFAK